ncbi:MAG: class A beta-lactamase-related serine hydrolase [Verrucomicrobia bacterium]|nr:class A beta-lactamase-related serine hydrolase [Verrucomicrobiota bacterium]NBU10732.1 class A beta-lactamase-related serine hydrolase [Pseudomonadota bacterium]NDA65642.1 class A beta-lactamase-related serine hydrolase [Verrucomicrobiota bacterium]NDB74944.1 class A beta-lactamase-related serine hydrolase [Verrucomicrobiota bacterium]NDD37521.1 class A beta-lactamase-related serine hydrolase [Verrucomicrobiota bacterium]
MKLTSRDTINSLLLTFTLAAVSFTARAASPIADALKPFVEKEELAGAVALVASKDKVLAVEAVGFADRATKRPMTPDALFWIASQSKPITAVAVLMLVDEGKLNLDDAVEKYLPEFKGQQLDAGKGPDGKPILKAPAHPITVREVLSHTSGLPFSSAVEKPTLDGLPLRDAVASYAKTPLIFEPSSKYAYSNAGINTAARLIEVITGQSYEAFMDARLFHPLGMKDTTFWPTKEQLTRLATPHKPNAAKTGLETTTISQLHYPLDERAKRYPMPAGGLFSTAADVAKFCQMLLNGGTLNGKRYLSAAAFKALTTRQTPANLKESYGLGFSVGGGGFGHGGALATNMNIDPTRGLITVWLVQHAGFPGEGNKAQGVFRKTAEEQFAKKP